jgi:hypothetical protein
MKVESQVCTLDQAKKLDSLGVSQNTLWQWKVNSVQSVVVSTPMSFWIEKYVPPVGNEFYAAFTESELAVMLGAYYETTLMADGSWSCDDRYGQIGFDYPAHASADRLIRLLEQGDDYLLVDSCNDRLNK